MSHTVDGVSVQTGPRVPGQQYAALVSASWVPAMTIVVLAGRYGAFAALSRRTGRAITRDELGAVTGVYRSNCTTKLSVVELVFDRDRAAHWGEPSPTPPEYVPAAWFARAAAALAKHDEQVLADRREVRVQQRKMHRALMKRVTVSPPGSPCADDDLPSLKASVGGGSTLDPRVLIKRGRVIVGRLYLNHGVLIVANEADRPLVSDFLEGAGHSVLPSIPTKTRVPQVALDVEWVGAWDIYRVSALTTTTVLALYFPSIRALLTANEVWDKPATFALNRCGLAVGEVVDGVPEGYSGWLLDRLTSTITEYTVPHDMPVADDETKQAPPEQQKQFRLSPPVVERLPALVATSLTRGLTGFLIDRDPPMSTRRHPGSHRTSLLNDEQLSAIGAAVKPVKLPPEAAEAVRWAASIAPSHAPLLAALRLHSTAPTWFANLPWVDEQRQRTGAQPGQYQSYLSEIRKSQAKTTGQAALVALLRDRDIPQPDFPKWMTQDFQARMFITVAALAHAGMVSGTPTESVGECTTCGVSYYPSRVTLERVLFAGSSRFCFVCVEGAWSGANTTENSQDTHAALAAIRALASNVGGPPSRTVLRGTIEATTETDLVVALLLRQALPVDSRVSNGLVGVDPASQRPWTVWLNEAGVLSEGWRPSFGTYSVATDGHTCRSLFERYIDDFLFSRAIQHEIEPSYPYDPELNPNGFRADWEIAGTLVEAAGMLGSAAYDQKVRTKTALAKKHGLDLVIVRPSDLDRLGTIFARWL